MSLRIVLVRTKNSANIGSAARAMKNFGVAELYLVSPRCSLDRQAYALASHAGDLLEAAKTVGTLEEALTGIRHAAGTTARERASEAVRAASARVGVKQLPAGKSAIVFGPEDTGLTNSELDRCQLAIHIPTASYASLNLAQAVNVLCYEWFQANLAPAGEADSGPAPVPDGRVATREKFEGMIRHLMDTLLYIGYTEPHQAQGIEHLYRRVFDRAQLTDREVAALRGLWAQTRWAAEQPPERVPGGRESR